MIRIKGQICKCDCVYLYINVLKCILISDSFHLPVPFSTWNLVTRDLYLVVHAIERFQQATDASASFNA